VTHAAPGSGSGTHPIHFDVHEGLRDTRSSYTSGSEMLLRIEEMNVVFTRASRRGKMRSQERPRPAWIYQHVCDANGIELVFQWSCVAQRAIRSYVFCFRQVQQRLVTVAETSVARQEILLVLRGGNLTSFAHARANPVGGNVPLQWSRGGTNELIRIDVRKWPGEGRPKNHFHG